MPKKQTLAVTAKEVAALAGVSVSAVSRSFTKDASVSQDKRSRVLQAAQRLGYRPDPMARSLMTKRSNIIGVAVGDLHNPFYVHLLSELSARLSAEGLHLLMFTSDQNAVVDVQLEHVLRYRVDALILLAARLSSTLAAACHDAGIPVLFINRIAQDAGSARSVVGENARGAAEIARFLIENDHRKLAFMAGHDDSSTSREREAAFNDHLRARGMDAPLRVSGAFTREGAVAATRVLLSAHARLDAIFCANDYMAIATIETARQEFGLEVGKDIAIVGFDDIAMASWPSIALTTFSQPADGMARQAVDLLLHLRNPREERPSTVVRGELIVRGSAPRRTRTLLPSRRRQAISRSDIAGVNQ